MVDTMALCVFGPPTMNAPPCRYSTTRPVPSAGPTSLARISRALVFGRVTVALTVPRGGTSTRPSSSINPNG
ncbi:Uncharacterised protein [Mycobacteroides abscessus subsp. abscessus]|nr:Uncharacterised protein [Mycobacteroides abscessus subsp. abscessus]